MIRPAWKLGLWIALAAALPAHLAAQAPAPLSIATTALPPATVGSAYSFTFTATGGTAPYRWAINNLPPGLSLASATGTLSGTPTATGTFSFAVQVTDSAQLSVEKTVSLTVNVPPLAIITVPPLFSATVGVPYSQTFNASGGAPPYRWAILSGQTGGLTLNAASGTLEGTPQTAGTFAFTIQVTDSRGATASQNFSVVINPPSLNITTVSPLPAGSVGTPYSQALSVTGGKPPYTWSASGSLPPGLTLSSSGTLSGTPTASGTFTLAVRVSDSAGLSGSKTFALTINPAPLRITSSTQLPDAHVAAPYSQLMTASGGVPPYAWAANGLPDGLTVNPSTGLISGTPQAAGPFTFTLRVTDATLASATDLFRINVSLPPPPSLTISGLSDVLQPAAQQLLQVSLDSTYPATLSGQLVLSFAPDAGAGDSTIRFSNGGRTLDFSIPAGSTAAEFSIPQAGLQTGTVAGTIIVSVRLEAFGVDVTPAPQPTRRVRIERAPPVITSARLNRTANGIEIEISGYSTAREVTQATFRFAATGGRTLQTSDFTVPLEDLFGRWFQDPDSSRFGSQFTFTQPFSVQGDATAVSLQSVTLTNRLGSATATP